VNTHVIYRCTKANTVNYYMHLPNLGDNSARGLSALRDGIIGTLTAVDGTATYTGWGDLVSTLRSIIATEAGTEPDANIATHAPETDREVNEYDHADHQATGDATLAAVTGHDYNRFWYIGYQNQYYPANLNPTQLAVKWGTVIAYDKVMVRLMGETLLHGQSDADVWVPRTIYRSELSSGTPPPPPGPPSAPSGLVATAVTGSQVDLAWADNSTNEQGFNVERAPDLDGVAGTYAVIATVGANLHTYSDATLLANVTYWYRVVAYNTSGSSSYSNESSAILVAPAAPSGLVATGISMTRIDLAWTDNSTDEQGFRVERAPDVGGVAGTYAQIASVGANVATYSNTGLTAGTRYWYRVIAYNGAGVSAYSTEASATTSAAPTPPNAPSALIATPISGVRIDLAWTDNSVDEQGFRVERAPDVGGVAGTYAQIASVGVNVITYSSTGLTAGTRYWYRVIAYNAAGTSAYSPAASATTNSAPNPPSALIATPASGTRINLVWTDNSADEQGFRVERAPDVAGVPGTFAQITSVGVNVTTYGNTGLANGTRYWYRVRAYNATGASVYSNVADATTLRLPNAPTNMQAVAVSPAMVNVSWTDNADNETSFRLERAPDNAGVAGSFAQVVTTGPDVTTYQNTGLKSGTSYWFRVRAQNTVGNSTFAPAVQVTTMPPVPPSDLAVRAYLIGTQRNAELTWTPGSEAKIDIWRAGTKFKSSINNTGGPLNYTSSGTLGLSVAYQVCLVGKTDAASCTLVVYANY
jgi:titin